MTKKIKTKRSIESNDVGLLRSIRHYLSCDDPRSAEVVLNHLTITVQASLEFEEGSLNVALREFIEEAMPADLLLRAMMLDADHEELAIWYLEEHALNFLSQRHDKAKSASKEGK